MTSRIESVSARMAAAAREMQDQVDPEATVRNAVRLLVRNVEGCHSASVLLAYSERRVETPAASDEVALTGDRLQHELGEGPALTTLWKRDMVYVPNLVADRRWPAWGPRLTELTGARSVLTFRLFTTGQVLGALSMYSTELNGFSSEDRAEGVALAAHIAVSVLAAQRVEHYKSALDSRTVIAQACGVLMERYDIDGVAAFALLTRISTSENIKIRDIAAELVLTRRLSYPGLAQTPTRTAKP